MNRDTTSTFWHFFRGNILLVCQCIELIMYRILSIFLGDMWTWVNMQSQVQSKFQLNWNVGIPCWETLFSVVPPSNSLVSVSDPWSVPCQLKKPLTRRPSRALNFPRALLRNYRDTRTPPGVLPYDGRSQDTSKSNWVNWIDASLDHGFVGNAIAFPFFQIFFQAPLSTLLIWNPFFPFS